MKKYYVTISWVRDSEAKSGFASYFITEKKKVFETEEGIKELAEDLQTREDFSSVIILDWKELKG